MKDMTSIASDTETSNVALCCARVSAILASYRHCVAQPRRRARHDSAAGDHGTNGLTGRRAREGAGADMAHRAAGFCREWVPCACPPRPISFDRCIPASNPWSAGRMRVVMLQRQNARPLFLCTGQVRSLRLRHCDAGNTAGTLSPVRAKACCKMAALRPWLLVLAAAPRRRQGKLAGLTLFISNATFARGLQGAFVHHRQPRSWRVPGFRRRRPTVTQLFPSDRTSRFLPRCAPA